MWFLIVPEGTVTHFHVLFQSVELFLQDYKSLAQKIKHGRRMIIFTELPTVQYSVVLCIPVNWNGQQVADSLELLFLNRAFCPAELPLAMLQHLLLPSLIPFENSVQGFNAVAIVKSAGKPSGIHWSW